MIKQIKKLFANETIRYIFFGGCTTLVNLVSYAILRSILQIDMTVANIISIALAILFAYVVNKVYVFESRTQGIKEMFKEASQFVGMRLGTMFIEVVGMIFLSCIWGIQDMIAKILIQVVVLLLNYVFSKVFVFNKDRKKEIRTEQEERFRKTKNKCCFFGFAIPSLTMALAFAVNGVFPFGDRGVLIIDSLHQYLPFFTEFHEKLANSENLLYSFGGGLGFNFWATFAYYLASPLNFLVALFPKENMMDVMALFIVLKIGLCGLTMSWYLVHRNKGRSYYPIAFSSMFALSSFIIGYYFNLMWLDSIAMLPLIMMGIERIVKGERKGCGLYCLSLFYGLYCNYYIGFMLCLFSCLYFLVQWVSSRHYAPKKILQSCVKFAWYSLLAGGMAAIVLLPAFLGLGTTESAENSFPTQIKFYVENLSQLTSHFILVEPITIADNQIGVNAFCGTAAMILSCLFVLDKKRSKRERMARVLLTLFLFASFDINALNFIWHGFHVQNGLPNRFAFLYIAMILIMGFDALSDIRRLSWKRIEIACVIPLAFVCYAAATNLGERELYTYVVTIVMLIIYGGIFIVYRTRRMREYAFRSAVISLLVFEMIATGIFGVCMNGTVGRSTYLNDQKAFEETAKRRQEQGFYRTEIDSSRMRNENMFMGANGVVLFSSTMPAATVDLCKSLGIEARTNKNGYNGYTKLTNDLFGVKYVLSGTNSDSLYQMQQVDYEDPLYLYQNSGALSLGFMVNSEIKDWDITQGIPMEVQNQFVELATGHTPIFFMNQNIALQESEKTYTIVLPAGKQVYLDMPKAVEKLTVTTPEYSKKYDKYNNHLYDLGCFSEDTTATVTATLKEGQESVMANAYVCDDTVYQEVHELLADEQMEQEVVEDGKIRGTITAKQRGTLLLTVPYDTGWTVKVDGEEVEAYRVGEAFTGIDLTEGTHTIAMDYTPEGLGLGTLISFICAGLYLATEMMVRKREE